MEKQTIIYKSVLTKSIPQMLYPYHLICSRMKRCIMIILKPFMVTKRIIMIDFIGIRRKYNNYANELHFINSELKDFNKLICFSLKVDWSENLEEWDIVERLHSLKPIRF